MLVTDRFHPNSRRRGHYEAAVSFGVAAVQIAAVYQHMCSSDVLRGPCRGRDHHRSCVVYRVLPPSSYVTRAAPTGSQNRGDMAPKPNRRPSAAARGIYRLRTASHDRIQQSELHVSAMSLRTVVECALREEDMRSGLKRRSRPVAHGAKNWMVARPVSTVDVIGANSPPGLRTLTSSML